MFSKFKEGVASSLDKDDFQAHYDLGVAYKEMGLLNDAIDEFQKSMNEKKLKFSSISMIGLCFNAKGDYSNAVKSFELGLTIVDRNSDEGLGLSFDMAESLAKMGNIESALKICMEIKAKKPGFRNITGRITDFEMAKNAASKKQSKSADGSKDLPKSSSGEKDEEDDGGEKADKKNKISYI
jgi:tetratricopeptide (TPR) repeat protein